MLRLTHLRRFKLMLVLVPVRLFLPTKLERVAQDLLSLLISPSLGNDATKSAVACRHVSEPFTICFSSDPLYFFIQFLFFLFVIHDQLGIKPTEN